MISIKFDFRDFSEKSIREAMLKQLQAKVPRGVKLKLSGDKIEITGPEDAVAEAARKLGVKQPSGLKRRSPSYSGILAKKIPDHLQTLKQRQKPQ